MKIRNVNYEQYRREIENKRIVCVGCEKLFDWMISIEHPNMLNKIDDVLDNYIYGNEICINGITHTIRNVNELTKQSLADKVILITSMYAKSLVEQIDFILGDRAEELTCFIYPIISLTVGADAWIEKKKK